MKKNSIYLAGTAILVAMSILVTSCKKEQPMTVSPGKSPALRSSSVSFPANTTPLSDLVENGYDEEDINVNKVLLHLGRGLTEIMYNSEYATWIHDQTSDNGNNELLFSDLFTQFPATKAIIESVVDPSGELSNVIFEDLESLLTHNNISYEAGIFLANAGETNGNLPAVVSPAIEVEDVPGGLHDAYFAWELATDGTASEVNVSEELAFNTSKPVFAVSLAGGTPASGGSVHGKTTAPNFAYKIDNIRINHRYEGSGSSEFVMVGYSYVTGTSSFWGYFIQPGYGNALIDWKTVKDVHKNDIGQTLTITDVNKAFFANNGFYSYSTYFNTYERDWINSKKGLGQVVINGNSMELKGNRKYKDEWYAFDPNQLSNNPVPFSSIYTNGSHTFSNSKGHFKVIKYVQ